MKNKNIFKTSLKIPASVKFQIKQNLLFLKASEGSVCLNISFFASKKLNLINKKINLSSFFRLFQKSVVGVSLSFVIRLAFVGVGFRVESIENNFIKLKLGFSHLVFIKIPFYVEVFAPQKTSLVLKSFDEQLLKEFCSRICFFRVPDFYKAKGIHYKNETLILKEGKKK
jgi:large subunit ribosomal protein L6